MNSEHSGLLKTRAENFARHLQTRLRSLSESEDNSWATEASSDSEVYYDIDSSLSSPEEEVVEPIFIDNKDSLQRTDSGTQYFDSLDNIPEQTPRVSSLNSTPTLHSKTGSIIVNGLKNTQDINLGCSRVHEIPQQYQEINDIIENNCDNNALIEKNNNTGIEIEEVADMVLDMEQEMIFSCDVGVVEEDTRPSEDELQEEFTQEESRRKFCVFCDIEQIKSSLSNRCLEKDTPDEEIIGNSHLVTNEFENQSDKVPPDSVSVGECSTENEGNVSLADLLRVLKEEISNDTQTNEGETSSTLKAECPVIEVSNSSPVVETKDKEIEDEMADIETKRKNFRRCSSLKSGKTPPGTPGRKKIVRFADVLGLDLADVKTFLDEVPTVPKSAYDDLQGVDFSSSPVVESPLSVMTVVTPQVPKPDKILIPLFQQPSAQPNFLDRVRENNVCVENAIVTDMSLLTITGVVRVRNIDFHKSVYIRYSIDSWRSFSDLQARYVSNSCDGFSDRFSFTLYGHNLNIGQRMEFAVRFQTAGAQFWDSNGGVNYVFECTSTARTYAEPSIPSSPMETWASFY